MTASTVAQYLAALPADRRAALSAVRKAINVNPAGGYEEGMQFGMIGWYVPLSVYPAGYGENRKVPLPFGALVPKKLAAFRISEFESPAVCFAIRYGSISVFSFSARPRRRRRNQKSDPVDHLQLNGSMTRLRQKQCAPPTRREADWGQRGLALI